MNSVNTTLSRRHRSAYHVLSDRVYSYDTCIWQRAGTLTIGNVTKYSVTTSRHQAQAHSNDADVRLDNVPQDTADLLQLAIDRDLIIRWLQPVYGNDNEPHYYNRYTLP